MALIEISHVGCMCSLWFGWNISGGATRWIWSSTIRPDWILALPECLPGCISGNQMKYNEIVFLECHLFVWFMMGCFEGGRASLDLSVNTMQSELRWIFWGAFCPSQAKAFFPSNFLCETSEIDNSSERKMTRDPLLQVRVVSYCICKHKLEANEAH